jgi:hypothetical protein
MTNETSLNTVRRKDTNERVFSIGDRVRLLTNIDSFFGNEIKKGKPGTVVDVYCSGGPENSYYGIEFPRDHALVYPSQIILHRDPIITHQSCDSKDGHLPARPKNID